MKKLIIGLAVLAYSEGLRYGIETNHAYPMINKTFITFEYQKLNDTVDILNLKEQELKGSLSNYASIGDMNGYKLNILKGFDDKYTAGLSLQKQSIAYGTGDLINKQLDTFFRYNFFQNDFDHKAYSIDIGATINKGDDIVYDDIDFLNSLGHKISPKFDIVKSSTNKYYIIDDNGNYVQLQDAPYLSINDMADQTLYIRLLKEYKFKDSLLLNYFIKFNMTSITTKINANDELANKAKEYGYELNKNLDRKEKSINIGFNVLAGTNYLFEFGYYYTKIFRDDDLDLVDYNHVINLSLSKVINRHWLIYAGGKIMYRQFNGEIPYLYNKYTQSTFEHKYGYAKVGFGYMF